MRKQCPSCKKVFIPILLLSATPEQIRQVENREKVIQDIFPHAKHWEREQIISGICSDSCWNKFLGFE